MREDAGSIVQIERRTTLEIRGEEIDESIAAKIGYPVIVRPSYVLGGRAMEIVYDENMLSQYMSAAVEATPERPILIDRYLENAIEAEADPPVSSHPSASRKSI